MSLYFRGAADLDAIKLGTVCKGQDGVIFNHLLFRFGSKGECTVYEFPALHEIASFTLDRTDFLTPHSNSVSFCSTFWAEGDEFPLLYTNLYNNYSKAEDKLPGVCCVYRITRDGTVFSSELKQIIRIGFTDDPALWRSETLEDIRPYGNFTADGQSLHVFVMRDEAQQTRFFTFRLPDATDGVPDPVTGIRTAVLSPDDILRRFDTDYIRFMQGAACKNGYLYSVEGFTNREDTPAYLRVIDLAGGREAMRIPLREKGLPIEPELIDVYDDRLYYADHDGNTFEFSFR